MTILITQFIQQYIDSLPNIKLQLPIQQTYIMSEIQANLTNILTRINFKLNSFTDDPQQPTLLYNNKHHHLDDSHHITQNNYIYHYASQDRLISSQPQLIIDSDFDTYLRSKGKNIKQRTNKQQQIINLRKNKIKNKQSLDSKILQHSNHFPLYSKIHYSKIQSHQQILKMLKLNNIKLQNNVSLLSKKLKNIQDNLSFHTNIKNVNKNLLNNNINNNSLHLFHKKLSKSSIKHYPWIPNGNNSNHITSITNISRTSQKNIINNTKKSQYPIKQKNIITEQNHQNKINQQSNYSIGQLKKIYKLFSNSSKKNINLTSTHNDRTINKCKSNDTLYNNSKLSSSQSRLKTKHQQPRNASAISTSNQQQTPLFQQYQPNVSHHKYPKKNKKNPLKLTKKNKKTKQQYKWNPIPLKKLNQ